MEQARELHQLSRISAGRRILSLLTCRNVHAVGRLLFRKLMQEWGLLSHQSGKHRYCGSREASLASLSLLKRWFIPAAPNQAWCGDISYIRIHGGWCYLAWVVALYSRRIVGFALSLSPDTDLVCRAMRNALEKHRRNGRLLFHSEQGSQYKSKHYRQLLWRNGIMQSMSRRGNCLDTSPMERIFRSLKSEWIPGVGYSELHHATQNVRYWLYNSYNYVRPHKHNEGLSPCEYKNQWE